jgi:bromodomain and WD repeat domain-containing protein 1/3
LYLITYILSSIYGCKRIHDIDCSSEEWNSIGRDSECQRIAEALEAIMSLAIAEPFNYPVDTTIYQDYIFDVEYPVDLTLVKSRVENHFYRRIEAILFDLKFLYENAARCRFHSFF